MYLADSWISRLNADGEVKNAPQEFRAMITRCIDYGRQTKGLFDVTVQPLWEHYQSGDNDLDEVLKLVDIQKVIVNGDSIKFAQAGMKLTLNGLVQGYLTDAITELLVEQGVENALVNGGEFRALGDENPASKNSGWQVQIMGSEAVISTTTLLSGEALAVSAGYGQTYAVGSSAELGRHLFHPSNGVKNPINKKRTFVVKADSAEKADVFATAVAVSQKPQWQALAKQVTELQVYEGAELFYSMP